MAAGAFVEVGRGGAGVLRRTAQADDEERHDADFIRFAYAQDAGEAEWDGRWRLLGLTVPESQQALRDRVRRTLVRLGAGPLNPGLYVWAHPW